MSPKTGRPKSDNPKDTRIQVRIDQETLAKLDECAEKQNTSRSEIIREGIDMVHTQKNIFFKKEIDFQSRSCYNNHSVTESGVKKMSPKMGRPKSDAPKHIRYSIRLDDETEKRLVEYCEKNNITRGEAVRRAINLLLAEK